jgi:DNA-binding NtrC family response regulator
VTQTSSQDLRVLICDDEYLLAMDMAQQFEDLQATVVGTVGNIQDLRKALTDDGFSANAVVLDVQYSDGHIFELLPLLQEKGIAIAIASGYGPEDRPDEYSHIPWLTKPTTVEQISAALCSVMDARSANQID